MGIEEFQRLRYRFHQYGGMRLVRTYARMGMLGVVARSIWQTVRAGRPFKTFYPMVEREVDGILVRQYTPLLDQLCERYRTMETSAASSDKVWFCWMQGLENAPEIVKVCHRSLGHWLKDKEIVVITSENYLSYIDMPEDIRRKFERGIIPLVHYSDMIRLQLLLKYGGTWVDSTVLCTGDNFPKRVLDCDLFLFQHLVKGDRRFHGISNWFISARRQNKLLAILRDMLFQYWRDYDCVVEYFVFHLFFNMIAGRFPDEIAKMPRGGNRLPLLLGARLEADYDEEWWQKLVAACCFHKLKFRVGKRAEMNEGSYYNHVLGLGF